MIFAFGDCELDERLFQLRRRGAVVRIEPKVFDVLLHLLRQRERVVSKRELLDALWPSEHVSESVLPRCIAAARRAVADDRSSQRVIQTVHGRGYRFVAPITASEARAVPIEPPLPVLVGSAFVGRDAAMQRLRAGFEEAAAGRGGVALVVGEPGIGKTRVIDELGLEVRGRGGRWLAGRCHEGEGAPAFWPWAQIVRAALDPGGPGSERDARDLCPLLADPHPPRSEPAEGAQARFRLFESVLAVLLRSARLTPLLITLDDLHWADSDSLLLFEFVATQIRDEPILVVASYRDLEVRRTHSLARTLGALAPLDRCQRVTLRGLDRDAVAALFTSVAGAPPAAALLSAVVEMTEGNPFFVHELVRLLVDDARLDDAGARALPLTLPQGVRDAIGRRLDSLSSECNEVLRAAAVLGRSFSFALLEHVVEPKGEALLELLGEALAAQVLVEPPGASGRLAFQHMLLRQTLYEELAVPQRVALHRRVAEALDRAFGARPDAPAAELAHHYFAAAPSGTAALARRWAVAAAERADEQHAYADSAQHLERALAAHDLAAPADEAQRCELLIGLGEARWTAGAEAQAREPLDAAAALARRLARVDLLARAAIAQHGLGRMGVAAEPRTLALLEEARDVLGDSQPGLRARILARLTGTPPHSASMQTRERLSAEALALARRAEDPAALLDAISARYWATLGPDRVDERLAVAGEAHELAGRWCDRRFELVGREIAIGAHLLRGELAEADAELAAYERVADELRQPAYRFLARMMRASREIDAGRFAEGQRSMHDALARSRGIAPHGTMIFAGQTAWLAVQRGEWDAVGRSLVDAAPLFAGQVAGIEPFVRLAPALAPMAADAGRRELAAIAARGFDDIDRDEHWLLLMALLAVTTFQLGGPEVAEDLYARLLPYRRLMVSHDLLRTVAASTESMLGLLAAAGGHTHSAVAHLEAGLAREEQLGLRPVALRTRIFLAGVLARRGAGADRARATRLEGEAAEEARRLGCRLPDFSGRR